MGYNDKQADLFGAIMGSMEGVTEAVGGALTANIGKKFASKGVKEGLKAIGLDVAENFLEESIMEPIQELSKQAIGKNGDWTDIGKRMLQAGIDGALTSIIMGGVSAGIGSAVKLATKVENNETISQEEIAKTLKDINQSEEIDIEKLLVDSFNFQAQDLMRVTEAQERKDTRLEKVAEDISQDEARKIKYAKIEDSDLTDFQKEKLIAITNKYDLSEKDIQDLIDNTKNGKYDQNASTRIENNEILNREQQTIQEENKTAQNGTSKEIKETTKIDIQKDIDDGIIKKRVNGQWLELPNPNNTSVGTNNNVSTSNNIIPQNDQNMQENKAKDYESIIENAKYISEEEKDVLRNYMKDIKKDEKTLVDFEKFVNKMNESSKEVYDDILNTEETYSTGRKEKYQKYLKSKSKYDSSSLNNAMDIIPANRQGRRTKEQWLDVAKQIGVEIANKNNQEIEEIAYRTWQDERPSSKGNLNRQGKKFVPFNSDDWINAIYNSVKEQREKSTTVKETSLIDEEQNKAQENTEKTVQEAQEPKSAEKEEKINLMPTQKLESEERKQRKHYKTIIESEQTYPKAKKIAKKLLGTDTYVPDSNKAQLERADQRIGSNPDRELDVLTSKIDNGDKLDSTDIAVSERLIEYYSKIGNSKKLETAIQNTALAGTQLGQAVQALSLINKLTPIGQVTYIERSIQKLNKEILRKNGYTQNLDGKILNRKGQDVTDKVELFNFTSEMQQKILNSNKENMNNILDEIYSELGNQVSKSTQQKIDSWRYFAMLGNIKTHNRNIIGNIAMGKTQRIKDKIAGGIEDIASIFNPNMERTKTLKFTDKVTKEFAKNDISNVATELGLNSNKYTAQNRLRDNMREFKSDFLNNTLSKLYEFNNTMLEVEDGWGLKSAYVKAFGDYITANKLDVNNISDTNLRKARYYAINQAQEATFHQASALASAINQFSARTKVGKALIDSVLPFIKTPINVAKAGLEYNPAGLVYNSIKGIHDLNTGKITVNQYIDNVSKGLTGTGITVLGYALAEAGIVKASGGDDDKEKYEQERGSQTYSIKIGDNTYTLDWLAPVGIPFFVGVEAHEIINAKQKEKSSLSTDDDKFYKQALQSAENILNAFITSANPMSEMSFLSGLTSTLKNYDQGVEMFGSILVKMGKSYLNQFVPTALGQVARVTDDKQRSTTSTATGTLSKEVDQTKNQIMSKIPGLRQKLPVATDIWGQEKNNDDNITRRAFETFIAPYTRKDLQTSKVDNELNNLYDMTGDDSIYPDKIDKTFTINKQDYRLTNAEYIKYSKDYGQNSYNIISNLVTSNNYQGLTDEEKIKAINNAYSYAKEVNKVNYSKKVNNEFETSSLYNVMNNISTNLEKSKYLIYLSEMSKDDIKERDKKSYILNSNMRDSTKEAIYKNSLGKNDELYQILYSIDKVNINSYLDYSIQDIKADEDEKSNIEGKTISGTKKNNLVNYFNNSSNLSLFDKLYIYGKTYKLSSQERKIVDEGIKNSNLSDDEKIEAYKKLSSSNIVKYKDGKIGWK